MNEERKIRRRMVLILAWILFFTLTTTGIITAYNQTRFISDGTEAETVRIAYNS